MQYSTFWSKYNQLPLNAKKEVIDFIDFLQSRYQLPKVPKQSKKNELSEEKFVGVWKDRKDMEESGDWVRDLRKREWDR